MKKLASSFYLWLHSQGDASLGHHISGTSWHESSPPAMSFGSAILAAVKDIAQKNSAKPSNEEKDHSFHSLQYALWAQ